MKALILAAGYGTRLARDLEAHKDEYPQLVGIPKPLLPVKGSPLVTHWIHMLQTAKVSSIYVVVCMNFVIHSIASWPEEVPQEDLTCLIKSVKVRSSCRTSSASWPGDMMMQYQVNAKYYDEFLKWSEDFSCVELVCDGTGCNEERLGAVACMQLAVQHFNIQDSLIVIGGDTLFFEDFSLSAVIETYFSSPAHDKGALVSCYRCKDEDTSKVGIVEINSEKKIVSFLEKPLPSATKSRLACPCFYILSQGSLKLLSKFLEDKKDSPLKERDATGHFLRYLSERTAVYTTEIKGRFDVGGLQSYLECCELYTPHS